MTLSCGCVNAVDESTGVMKCTHKCKHHTSYKNNHPAGKDYYERLGVIQDGIPHCSIHITELRNGLKAAGVSIPKSCGGTVIEIGGGASMYCPEFLSLGYQYLGVEPSAWGSLWTKSVFNVPMYTGSWEEFTVHDKVDLIFSAHCFEHLADSPAAIRKAYDSLISGGHLCLVLPDDSDQTNPDHFWFYTPATLRSLLSTVGFHEIAISTLKIVQHENFIYCLARKP